MNADALKELIVELSLRPHTAAREMLASVLRELVETIDSAAEREAAAAPAKADPRKG